MSFLILALIPVYLILCMPFASSSYADGSYMGKERTALINGIFILFVFAAHVLQYLPDPSVADEYTLWLIRDHMDQLIVACFLFNSGYGVAESIRAKGVAYLKGFPRKRIIRVLLHFSTAVTLFALVRLALGDPPAWKEYAKALVGWSSIGNSNWYIFVICCQYVCFWVSFTLSRGKAWGVCILFVSTGALLFTLLHFKDDYWWNTLLCFPAGVLLSYMHGGCRKVVSWLRVPPCIIGLVLVVGLPLVFPHKTLYTCPFFAYGVALMFSGIRFRRKPVLLLWAGGALFSIYILQRIPMLIMDSCGIWTDAPWLFISSSFAATLLMAWVAPKLWSALDTHIIDNPRWG